MIFFTFQYVEFNSQISTTDLKFKLMCYKNSNHLLEKSQPITLQIS